MRGWRNLRSAVGWRNTLIGLQEAGDASAARIDTPHGQESFDYVFGADGAQSAVRQAMAVEFEGYTHRRQWSMADADIDDGHTN
ncbi:hypothetical protein EJ076_10375 [Mesorhizobium sp. M7D.F.Ca.US.005.01.1.1]|nr:hypothetical protein EJ076_10375 [Mesorhizobium sp. M7D.F.Ca.US.005.01.1.1]